MTNETDLGVGHAAVLIVAYRSATDLDRCLRSVRAHCGGHHVHVWDNSETDYPGVRQLSVQYPWVRWHFGEGNIGFAAAVNRLAALAGDVDLLLLNPDAELLGPLDATFAAIAVPGTAAAGPLNLESDGSLPRTGWRRARPWDVARRRITVLNALGGVAGLGPRLRGTPFSRLYLRQPRRVSGYLMGSCLAISRAAWNAVGPFDEEFFLYGEEADWQARATSMGWRLTLADEVGVRHSGHGTVRDDPHRGLRSRDLVRAAGATALQRRRGTVAAESFLAIGALLDRLRETRRGAVRQVYDAMLPIDAADGSAPSLAADARRLAEAGHRVAVLSLGPLRGLPGMLPASVRLIRGDWWWPPVLLPACSGFIEGPTARGRRFIRLFGRSARRMTVHDGELVEDRRTRVLLSGPGLHAASGVSTHLRTLLGSGLASRFQLLHFRVGSEGRREGRPRRILRIALSPLALAIRIVVDRPAIVHINTSLYRGGFARDTAYLVVALLLRRRVILQVHGIRGGRSPADLFAAEFLRKVVAAVLRAPDAVVVLGTPQLRAFGEFEPRTRLRVIPNALQCNAVQVSQRGGEHPLRLIYLGRLIEAKGVAECLAAAGILQRAGRDFTLLVAGGGPAEASLQELAGRSGLGDRVRFAGEVPADQVGELWSASDVFVFPSEAEGLSYALLESMAAGVVPITTPVGAHVDVVTDGVDGIFVPPRDPQAIVDAIVRLDDDRAALAAMSVQAALRIRRDFPVSRLVADFADLYRELS